MTDGTRTDIGGKLAGLVAAAESAGGSLRTAPGRFPGRTYLILVAGAAERELCEVCRVEGDRVTLAAYDAWEDDILFGAGFTADDACFLDGSVGSLQRAVTNGVRNLLADGS